MSKIVEIHVAELVAADKETHITTNGIGSCIVIILYDRLARVGGMAHAILPHRGENDQSNNSLLRDSQGKVFVKYADQAVGVLLAEMHALGAADEHIEAKLVGGAHMFTLLEGDQHGIGWQNTESARTALSHHGIRIETEVVGGTVGRNLRFDCATGIVEITTKV